jgi:SAM-dependent methyltransferase
MSSVPLAYYSRAATQEFWSEHWAGEDVGGLVRIAAASPLTAIIEAALPPTGRILEAGCGLGQYVILLRERGRAVIGADWSLEALRRCRVASPSAPVGVMDLGRLAVRAGALAAYVSLGVAEHDREGPSVIVAEAARVLQPGGRLLLSVPYWNGARRLLTPHLVRTSRRIRAAGGEFYQFAFTRREVREFVEAAGLAPISYHPYDPARMWRKRLRRVAASLGQAREVGARVPAPATAEWDRGAGDPPAPAAPRARPRRLARALLRRLLYSEVSLRMFGHMILAVAVKP